MMTYKLINSSLNGLTLKNCKHSLHVESAAIPRHLRLSLYLLETQFTKIESCGPASPPLKSYEPLNTLKDGVDQSLSST